MVSKRRLPCHIRNNLGSKLRITYLGRLGSNHAYLMHLSCGEKTCEVYKIEKQDYQQCHVADCTCNNILTADGESVTSRARSSRLPLRSRLHLFVAPVVVDYSRL
jgi:hypothetical protein